MTLTREKLQNKKEFHEQELKKIENKTLKFELKTLKDEVKVLEDALEEKESENIRPAPVKNQIAKPEKIPRESGGRYSSLLKTG